MDRSSIEFTLSIRLLKCTGMCINHVWPQIHRRLIMLGALGTRNSQAHNDGTLGSLHHAKCLSKTLLTRNKWQKRSSRFYRVRRCVTRRTSQASRCLTIIALSVSSSRRATRRPGVGSFTELHGPNKLSEFVRENVNVKVRMASFFHAVIFFTISSVMQCPF